VPDFIIAMDGGRTLWVEAKAKGGKLKTEQVSWISALNFKCHIAFVVWSFQQFLDLVKRMEEE